MRYRVEVKTADGWVEVGSTDDRKQLPALIGKAIDYPYRFGLRVTDAKTGKRLMDEPITLAAP